MRGTFSAFVEMRTKLFISLGFRSFDLDLWLSLDSGVCWSIVGSATKKKNTTVSRCSEFFYVKWFFGALWCKKRKRRLNRLPFCILQHCIAGWFRYANRANKEIHRAKLFECCVTLFSVDLTPSIFRSSLNILRCFFSPSRSLSLCFFICVLFETLLHLQQQ